MRTARERVGKGGGYISGVGGSLDAVDDNVSLEGVGVEETSAALLGNGDNGDLGAIGSDQHVTEDNSRGSNELAVGVDVVVG
jgi:hypothetical protein